MKKIFFLILSVFFMYSAISQPFMTENDFKMMKEDDPNYKIERQKWMEEMHRAAPGTDWRKINADFREQKYRLQKNRIEQLIKSGFKRDRLLADTVAEGKIVGEWIERGSNNLAGRMMTCDIDWETGFLYNASHGGNIWRGTLEGEDWTCLNNNKQMTGIVLLKIIKTGDKKRIFVISGRRGFYSDDEGLTWEESKGLEKPQNWGGVKRAIMANDENNTIYFFGNEWDYGISKSISCLYRSTDHGETFEEVYKSELAPNMCDLWASKYFSDGVFFQHLDTLSRINQDGKIENILFIDLDMDLDEFKNSRIAGSSNKQGITLFLWLQNKSNSESHFYRSNDSGNSWKSLATLNYGPFMTNSFEASCIYPEAVYFGGVNCSRSYDSGDSWELVNTWGQYYSDIENKLHADIPAITSLMDPEGEEVVIISTDGGSYISYDNLATVKNISLRNLNVSQYYTTYSYRKDPDIIFVGSQDQGFQRTTAVAEDGTHSFQQTISGDYAHLTSSDGGETVWHVYPGFSMVYKYLAEPSLTRAATLKFEETGTGGLWLRPILADPDDADVAYLAGGGTDGFNHIWRLRYSGGKITGQEMPYQFSEGNNNVVSALGISNINTNLFYAMTKMGWFFYSTDRGQNWKKSEGFSGLGGHYFYGASIASSNTDTNTVYIAGSGYSNPGVLVSYDHGESFTPIDSGLPNTLVYRIALSDDDKYIFAATAVGPYVYIKDEGMWFDLAGINTPDQSYWCVEYIPSIMTARFGTYGRGIWDFRIDNINRIDEVALLEPENGSLDITLDTILRWSESENAEFYHLQIATNNSFRNIIFERDSIYFPEINISELQPNEKYYWRVKAKKENYISSWSNVFSFETVIIMPYPPSLKYPGNKDVQVELMPIFEWEEIPYASSYHMILADNPEFEDPEIDVKNIQVNSYEYESYLDKNTTYFWMVKSKIKDFESEFSDISTFTTVMPKPNSPVLEYPEFAQNNVPLNVKMVWSEVENAEFYSLQLASDNQFNDILFEKDTIRWFTYKFMGDELESFRLYHWHAKANNKSGASDWSDRGMFVTGNEIGIKEIFDEKSIIIYPNPTSEKLLVNFKTDTEVLFSIANVLGNKVMNGLLDTNRVIHTIDISNLIPGTYFIRIENPSGIIVRKINVMK
jgi:hypothetical protein